MIIRQSEINERLYESEINEWLYDSLRLTNDYTIVCD